MDTRAFGIDFAGCNGKFDWTTLGTHNPKPVFAGIRAGISWGYQDNWFPTNWPSAKLYGILRMAYHVIYPDQAIKTQVDNFTKVVGSDKGELPPVIDAELDRGCSIAAIRQAIYDEARYLEDWYGRKPIIYSRTSWIKQFLDQPAWLGNYDWWLALYLDAANTEHPGPVPLPAGITKYLIHQTSNTMSTTGWGMPESKAYDADRWNGVDADVYAYAGVQQPGTSTEQPASDDERIAEILTLARETNALVKANLKA